MKVLWIRFGAFGDVLQATARARFFKRVFPHASLTMLTRPEYQKILSVQDCYEDLILWDSKRDPLGLARTVRDIRRKKFDMLVSVHNSGSAAMVSLFSGIPERYGQNKNLQFCYDKNVWDWFRDVGINYDLRDVPMIQSGENSQKFSKKIFCIIGASKPQKIWPIDYWIEFLRPLVNDGWEIVLNGHGEKEKSDAERIQKEIGNAQNVVNLVDKLDYLQMAAVAQECTVAVGPDTGPLHLSALVGTPTLGLFGCTPSQKIGFTMPWFSEVLCTCPDVGCFNYKCPKGEECMKTLLPEMALAGLHKMGILE